ncbi:MAG: hypothetical protein M3Q48_17845, partial [Actinomycetota bacterium]|nr:hypothetical protein [Actinomycetota bacterium]
MVTERRSRTDVVVVVGAVVVGAGLVVVVGAVVLVEVGVGAVVVGAVVTGAVAPSLSFDAALVHAETRVTATTSHCTVDRPPCATSSRLRVRAEPAPARRGGRGQSGGRSVTGGGGGAEPLRRSRLRSEPSAAGP